MPKVKLTKDMFIILMYKQFHNRRFLYFDRQKKFDSIYTHEYIYSSDDAQWGVYSDETLSMTYHQMHKERRKG